MKLEKMSSLMVSIQKEMEESPDTATAKWIDLLRDLLRRDEFYILKDEGSCVVENQNKKYFRVFTHVELAEKLGQAEVIDSLSLVTKARELFFAGFSGFLLNDGDAWSLIDLVQLIDIFLGLFNMSASDPEFVAVASAIAQADKLYCYETAEALVISDKSGNGSSPLTVDILKSSELPIVFPGNDNKIEPGFIHDVINTPVKAASFGDLSLALPSKPTSIPAEIPRSKHHLPKLSLPKLRPLNKCQIVVLGSILAGALAFLIVLSIILGSSISKFTKAIDRYDYSFASELYYSYEGAKRDKANQYLLDIPMKLVTDYASGDISKSEFDHSINSLSTFSVIGDQIPTARRAGEAISKSREAFSKGQENQDIPSKLLLWEDVIEADRQSCIQVQKDLKDNAKQYKATIYKEIDDRMACGMYGRAYNLAALLYRWYPDDPDVKERLNDLKEYQNQADNSLSQLPVEIQSVTTSIPSLSDDVDLFIQWRNISKKEISKIVFYTVPISNSGRDMSNFIYQAIDNESYSPGSGPVSETWGWANAWHGADIIGAKIIKIEVTFSDGVSREFNNF